MKVYLITFSFFIYSFYFFLNLGSTVNSSPFPANDCDNLSITINGNLSASNCTYVSSYVISGNLITIDINVTCGGLVSQLLLHILKRLFWEQLVLIIIL